MKSRSRRLEVGVTLICLLIVIKYCDYQLAKPPVATPQAPRRLPSNEEVFITACEYRNLEEATQLLNLGVNPNLGMEEAIMSESKEMIELLIKRGGDLNMLHTGHTSLDVAIYHHVSADTISLIREHGGKRAAELGAEAITPSTPEQIKASDIKQTVVFTRSSNGYAWRRADFQSKQRFCETTATAESREFGRNFTPSFYMDALDSFYSSSDASILNNNIHKIIGLTTSASMNQ